MKQAFVGALAVLVTAAIPFGGMAQTRSADEQAIWDEVATWNRLIAAKDVAGVVGLYAADGMIMPTGAPAMQGHAALTQVWTGMLGAPGLKATLTPIAVTVAKSGDLASEQGRYEITTTGANGPTTEKGKYIVVWKKVGGKWKVANDIFNADGPAS
ncbi:MAG TPA: DUF4440 domain-containing protein [Phenylobacterium sp.]